MSWLENKTIEWDNSSALKLKEFKPWSMEVKTKELLAKFSNTLDKDKALLDDSKKLASILLWNNTPQSISEIGKLKQDLKSFDQKIIDDLRNDIEYQEIKSSLSILLANIVKNNLQKQLDNWSADFDPSYIEDIVLAFQNHLPTIEIQDPIKWTIIYNIQDIQHITSKIQATTEIIS